MKHVCLIILLSLFVSSCGNPVQRSTFDKAYKPVSFEVRNRSIYHWKTSFNLRRTWTAFGLGAATCFDDKEVRRSILKTAEHAGFSVAEDNQRHYLLANVALVGEAITQDMRTAIKWDFYNEE